MISHGYNMIHYVQCTMLENLQLSDGVFSPLVVLLHGLLNG